MKKSTSFFSLFSPFFDCYNDNTSFQKFYLEKKKYRSIKLYLYNKLQILFVYLKLFIRFVGENLDKRKINTKF